jgi:hypothetical protein
LERFCGERSMHFLLGHEINNPSVWFLRQGFVR